MMHEFPSVVEMQRTRNPDMKGKASPTTIGISFTALISFLRFSESRMAETLESFLIHRTDRKVKA